MEPEEHRLKKTNRQPNSITMSKQQFEVIEKRIMYLVINQVKTGRNIQEDVFKENLTVLVPIKHLGDTNYERIRSAAKSLSKRQIALKDDKRNKTFDYITPFPRIKTTNNSYLEVTILADTIPYFAELNKGYTNYLLASALSLHSKHSQRIYEIISRFKDTKFFGPIPISEFREMLSIEDSYKEISMLKARVLEPARNEIAEKTELGFNYVLTKTGRKYTHIKFTIYGQAPKDQQLLKFAEDFRDDDKSERCKVLLKALGIIRDDLVNEIVNYQQKEFWEWHYKYSTGALKVSKNPAGLLLTTLGLTEKK
ncbi:MAG: replication initiation protein [Bacteroidota bacterium]